ncbi:trypsin-like serine protease [Pseudovirgaria hyperparasitica]|uniref:Trypsin-like serine protease n=1 Tax=Pseudovirgaria hyperparasitica TaxID=470096 RepID=A0A6A6WAV5_9PEZI|nr:trypsin-like serine protease [Pseudovirgaria hyperparasitica]KAF2759090.1 trypsin-like serine protease [Pseudovirgaria hyperparasitica]
MNTLPASLTTKSNCLSKSALVVLNKKQRWLRHFSVEGLESTLHCAINATLIFAQEEAGTAVCISRTGLILTCAHCIAEDAEEFAHIRQRDVYHLFASGSVVSARCIAWDATRDLALLRIVASQDASGSFSYVSLATQTPRLNARLVCVGHPGSDDLEVGVDGAKTGYDILHVSTGRFRGLAKGQSIHDNSEIGALKHDCWTYWGHSGAPLVNRKSGEVVGLHSSWDEETGMRRGIALKAILDFLLEQSINLE